MANTKVSGPLISAYVVTGLVEEHFSTVTLTVRTLRLLTTRALEVPLAEKV